MNQEYKSLDYNLSKEEKLECSIILSYLSDLLTSDESNKFSNERLDEDGSYVKIVQSSSHYNSYNCSIFVPDFESPSKKLSLDHSQINESKYKEWIGESSIINIEDGFISYAIRGPAKLSVNLISGEKDLSVYSDGNYDVTLVDRMRFMAAYIVNLHRVGS